MITGTRKHIFGLEQLEPNSSCNRLLKHDEWTAHVDSVNFCRMRKDVIVQSCHRREQCLAVCVAMFRTVLSESSVSVHQMPGQFQPAALTETLNRFTALELEL